MATPTEIGGSTPLARRKSIPLGRRVYGTILRFLIWLFLRVEVREASRVPEVGAGIVYYNHIHWLDPVIICGQLHRYAIPLTKIEVSRWPLVGWILKGYHVIFISRGTVDRAALKATWQLLRNGDISVISPEGTRSLDGRLLTAKEGLAFVARQAPDCWLIPAAVTGTPSFRWKIPLINRPTAVITYGRPFRYRWPRGDDGQPVLPEGRASREVLREMTDAAMTELAQFLPANMRGAYANADSTKNHWLEFI